MMLIKFPYLIKKKRLRNVIALDFFILLLFEVPMEMKFETREISTS